jgi:hypothetical protein
MPAMVANSHEEGASSNVERMTLTPLQEAQKLATALVTARRGALKDHKVLLLDWYKVPEAEGEYDLSFQGVEEEEEKEEEKEEDSIYMIGGGGGGGGQLSPG